MVTPCRSVQKHIDLFPTLAKQREFKVGRLLTIECLADDPTHTLLVLGRDVVLNQRLTHGLAVGVPHELFSLVVPLRDVKVRIDTKDGRVGRVNETPQVIGNTLRLLFDNHTLGNVLPHTNHPHNLLLMVTPCRGVEKHIDLFSTLAEQREFKVGRLLTIECLADDLTHTLLVLGRDVVLNQRLAHSLTVGVPHELFGLVIPLGDVKVRIDTKDGRVGRVNETPQVIGNTLRLNLSVSHIDGMEYAIYERC